MRIQFWPSVNFWHYVSIAGIMMVPYGFYRFYLDFLEEKQKGRRRLWFLFFLACYIVNWFTQIFIPTPEVVTGTDGHVKLLLRMADLSSGACGCRASGRDHPTVF